MSSLPTLARLLARFRPVAPWAAAVFVVLLLRSVLEVSFSYIVGWALDTLGPAAGRGGPLPDAFVLLLWLLGGTLVARNVVAYAASVTSTSLGQELENRFRTDLFAKVTRLHFRYHDLNRSGATIARSLRDMEKAKRFFREVAFGYLEIALVAVGIVVMSFVVHWTYGLLVLATVAATLGLSFRVGAEIATRDRLVSDDYDLVTTVLQENVAGARVVRAFGREPEEMGKFGAHLASFTGGWRGVTRFWTARMPGIHSLFNAAYPAALLLGVWRTSAGVGTIGEVATILLYVGLMKNRMRPFTRMIITGQEAVASAARVFEVLDHGEETRAPSRPVRLPATGGEVRIEDVRFGHRDDLHVLRGVSLHVPAGSSLGIIGPTGAGKSTLVSLLPRYYDPDHGRILLDGVDLRDLDPAELRQAVGLVFQEPFLFSATVLENLRYGRPDATRAEVEEAARQAAAHDFVTRLPLGYETLVGERGVSLSGGQRQRLTIARALVMHPRLLVFDDATAAVDAITERRLFQGIRSAAVGRTAIVISQRVTSVRWCERIAVLDAGSIQHVGTHEELLARNALYREIASHQSLVAAGGGA